MRVLWLSSEDAGFEEGELHATLARRCELEVDNPVSGLQRLRDSTFDLALVSLPMDGWSAEEILEEIQHVSWRLPVLLRDAGGTLEKAVRLIKLGAFHYFDGGTGAEDLCKLVETAVEYRRSRDLAEIGSALGVEPWRKFLVGESHAMQNIAQVVRLIGARRCTVFVTGETGTGKEMVARAIHLASSRAHLPMIPVNCSALPENLLEAELFGHVRGAFTGAVNQRIGRFEQAHRSTLFLDEIADMPLDLQAKLLRVLQEREFQRLGSSETIRVDVRIIAATNVDLTERIRAGRFREDLFYRLNVVPVRVPPLRERIRDIPLLVLHFLDKICQQEELPPKRVAPETLERLCRYEWPGNVRQLENGVEMAIALSGEREVLHPGDFPLPSHLTCRPGVQRAAPSVALPDEGLDFEQLVGGIERSILEQALRKTHGNKKQAAEMLRLKRTTLTAKLKSIGAGLGSVAGA